MLHTVALSSSGNCPLAADAMSRTALILACCLLLTCDFGNAQSPVVELETSEAVFQGRDIAHTREICWLEAASGAYQEVQLSQVVRFRKIADDFEPASAHAVAAELRTEMGRGFEVSTLGQYVVAAPRGRGRFYGQTLEEVSRSAHTYFSRRGFRMTSSDVPLTVIVYPNRDEFLRAAQHQQQAVGTSLQGFYSPVTNRMLLYDDVDESGMLTAMVSQTLAHEGIHQFCYNKGLTTRLAPLPVWLIEGLALNLELENGRQGSGSRQSRVHIDRLRQYRDFIRRSPDFDLAAFVSNEHPYFEIEALDAYAVSWALTFYLMETRSADFSKYLKELQSHTLFNPYPAHQRLVDFQAHFGKDVSWLQVGMNRFMDELELK